MRSDNACKAGHTHVVVTNDELRALLGAELFNETASYAGRMFRRDPALAERQVIECLRYLYLISSHPQRLRGLFLPVEQPVDEVWHYLILQTREYRALCERLPGAFSIEHRSLPYASYQQQQPSRRTVIEQALRWIPLYCKAFGPFDEGALPHWTIVRFLHKELGLSLEEISTLDAERAA